MQSIIPDSLTLDNEGPLGNGDDILLRNLP